MGASCCGCCKLTLQPKKVHIKQLVEIYKNYLKNANESGTKGWKGHETLSAEVISRAEKYAKTSCKDLVKIM